MSEPDRQRPEADRWRAFCRRLGIVFYPGEGSAALLLFAGFFLCVTFQYASKTVRQATFIDALGATQLPWVYLLVAVLSYPAAWLFTRLSHTMPRRRLVLVTFASVLVGLVVFWWLFARSDSWVPVAFYVWISIAIALTMSQLWLLASEVFDARQAKRLFGFLGGGALLGGIAGGLVARWVAALSSTRDCLLAAAVLVVGVMVLLPWIGAPAEDPAAGGRTRGERPRQRPRLSLLGQSQHLRLVGVVMLLAIVVSQVVDLQFNWAVETATSGLENRTEFFGNFFSLMGVAALVFQLLFTSRIHRVLGVGFALRVLPVSLSAGTLALLITGTLFPGGVVVAALALKIAESGVRYSVDDSTRELLFLPLRRDERVSAKALVDVVIKRGAKGLAAILLLPVTLGWITPLQASWLSLVVIAVWLVATRRLIAEYIRSFRRGLEHTAVDSDSTINLQDVTTLEILVESLGSADARQVLHSLELLAAHGRGHLVPPLLLYHDDPDVRCRTLEVLAAAGREDAAPLVERRLSDDDPEVRAAATRVLADLLHQDACDLMLPRLRAADAGVRAAAVACLANHGGPEMLASATATLEAMITDGDSAVRIEAARAIGAIVEAAFAERLVNLLYDPDPAVVRAAISSIRRRCDRDGPNPLYLPTLISLLVDRHLKHDARQALAAYGDDAIPALTLFMKEPEEPIWVRRAIPKTIASIPGRAARQALTECLGSQSDGFLRRKLLEALGSIPGQPVGPAAEAKVRSEIHVEAKRYLIALADLEALDPAAAQQVDAAGCAAGGLLLERLLAERAGEHRHNLFALLALLYEREPIWDAYRGLYQPGLRAGALEYLDYTLKGQEHHDLLAAIGDSPLGDKLALAERLFGFRRADRVAVLHKHLSPQDVREIEAPFLTVGAIHAVEAEALRELYPVVRSLQSTATDLFVVETAAWAMRRIGAAGEERPA